MNGLSTRKSKSMKGELLSFVVSYKGTLLVADKSMLKTFKSLFVFMLVLTMGCITPICATEDSVNSTTVVKDTVYSGDDARENASDALDKFPEEVVTSDQINEWIDLKGADLLTVLQRIVQWITLIAFIICLVKAIFGLFGRGDVLGSALWGCVLCITVYSLITFVPDILAICQAWAMSGLPK